MPYLTRFARLLILLVTIGGVSAVAPQADAQVGDYGGTAKADIAHVQALNIPDVIQVADVGVAPAEVEVSSSGLEEGNARARAANVDLDVLSGTIDESLLVEAVHIAPGEPGPVQETLLDVPLDPLLNAQIASATAHSRWSPGACIPPGTPISEATTEVTSADVLTDTPAGAALVSVGNAEDGAAFTRSTVELADVEGTGNRAVVSRAVTQITGLTLFEGTPNQLTVNVLAPPEVEAIASGQPGGATVTYSEPVLQVVDSTGAVLGELNAADANFELDLAPLATLRLGTLDATTAADGTSASGSAVLLEIIVGTGAPLPLEPGLRVTIAGGEVSAFAPTGGVVCPVDADDGGDDGTGDGGDDGTDDCGIADPMRDLHIGPSTLAAAQGSTFTYTIGVSNLGECTLEDVRVETTITGPSGSQVVSTDPAADTVDGLSVVWNDVGPLDPGGVTTLTITVSVPDGAPIGDSYQADVTATATGGGEDFTQNASTTGPEVVAPGSGACDLSDSGFGPSHEEVEPGQTFNLYTTLLNSGGEPCPNVTVTLPLDDDLEFVSCSDDCTFADGVITWTIPEIGPGDSQTLVATVRVPADVEIGTQLMHEVTITSGDSSTTLGATGPVVSGNSVLAPFPSAGTNVLGQVRLPGTGADALRMVAIAMLLLSTGLALRMRSRFAR